MFTRELLERFANEDLSYLGDYDLAILMSGKKHLTDEDRERIVFAALKAKEKAMEENKAREERARFEKAVAELHEHGERYEILDYTIQTDFDGYSIIDKAIGANYLVHKVICVVKDEDTAELIARLLEQESEDRFANL